MLKYKKVSKLIMNESVFRSVFVSVKKIPIRKNEDVTYMPLKKFQPSLRIFVSLLFAVSMYVAFVVYIKSELRSRTKMAELQNYHFAVRNFKQILRFIEGNCEGNLSFFCFEFLRYVSALVQLMFQLCYTCNSYLLN